MYVAMDLANSLFRHSGAAFYASPPVGYGLVACAHVAYLVSVEWAGVLHVTPVSDPFFLGSRRTATPSLPCAIMTLARRLTLAQCRAGRTAAPRARWRGRLARPPAAEAS